jgi:hypothetical protein
MGTTTTQEDLHVSRRKAESKDANADLEVDAADERIQQEMGQPKGGFGPALCLVQLLPCPSNAESNPCDGSRDFRSRLVNYRAYIELRPFDILLAQEYYGVADKTVL